MGRSAKVMLVEDNPDLAIVNAMLLRSAGFTVVVCSNGKECIEQAETVGAELILMDLDMPVMDGKTACEWLRTQPWGKSLPIVAFTGHRPALPALWFKQAGFDGVLAKPADADELAAVINEAIQRKTRR